MGKRLNPHRRLLARQAKALAAERSLQSVTNGADAAKLQQGRVRSSADGRMRVSRKGDVSGALTSNRPVHFGPWEGRGTRGKIVRGQLKRVIPGQRKGWSKT